MSQHGELCKRVTCAGLGGWLGERLAWGGALLACVALFAVTPKAIAQTLTVDGTTMTMGGVHNEYRTIRVINGGVIRVQPYNGTDRVNTGNLVLVAESIYVDSTSRIDARGSGYQTLQCGDGRGPSDGNGGRGGCSVIDSGGGGAHFGRGGRGTKDCNTFGSTTSCQFPQEYEEACTNTRNSDGSACTSTTSCRNNDGLPSVAGTSYWHNIYDIEFGASGGDKGCRDNHALTLSVGGGGGGRVVLVGLTDDAMGTVQIDGTVTAHGKRGCGTGNDSGGGGAGGSILIVGDQVQVGASALITAAGGLGGDTRAGASGQPDYTDCPMGSQTSGTCDDCGGGGGGGIVSVLSRSSNFDHGATFDVGGADGGTCTICKGEAGGGAGELQIDGAYVGEICDGYDNDFDGETDEGLGSVACGLGTCARSIDACTGGQPTTCDPSVTSDPTCVAERDAARPRIAVILDSSASMLLNLSGYPTFGDGSEERPGLDTDGDDVANDSRLFLARAALGEVVSAYPEIDFALARYHQDQGELRACQTAAWFECAGLVGTYDNPTDNTGSTVCSVSINASETVAIKRNSNAGDECINYAGSCGGPRRGADILSGFGTPTRDLVRWLDARESNFIDSAAPGNVCDHLHGGDCEIRGTGPTPLAGSLQAVEDYVAPIRSTDAQTACRTYSVILVTDGAESCNGDPVAAAQHLFTRYGIQTYVVAVSVLEAEEEALNAIAAAGSGGARTTATFVRAAEDLVPALSAIIEGSIRFERCNGEDDDCDGLIDETFPSLGTPCADSGIGVCKGTGAYVCSDDELSTECEITMPGLSPGEETCNGLDDDCDNAIDEGLMCTTLCTPSGDEVCNGVDDDCDGFTDEEDPALGTPCGQSTGICEPGVYRCVAGRLECLGGVAPRDEQCNGLDDDCDGNEDMLAECPGTSLCIQGACRVECLDNVEFPCPPGFECSNEGSPSDARYCLPSACLECGAGQRCENNQCVDPCVGVTCARGMQCVAGECVGCQVLPCTGGLVCRDNHCVANPCDGVECADGQTCSNGICRATCGAIDCPAGQRCDVRGMCEADPCTGISCADDRFCDDGQCRANPCHTQGCPQGLICVPALGCVDDPCAVVQCPAGRTCVVRNDGETECADAANPTKTREYVVGTGGGLKCSASAGSSGNDTLAWLSMLSLVGVVVRRRARRAGTQNGAAR